MIKKQFITDDILVFLADNDTLLGVDIYSTRTEIWRVSYPQNGDSQLIDVVAVNRRIYVVSVEKDYAVSLLNVYNGTLEWTVTMSGFIEPKSLVSTDKWLLLISRKKYASFMQAIDVRTGQPVWDFVMGGHGEGFDPIIADRYVYAGGADQIEHFRRGDKEIYLIRIYCLDIVSGELVWVSHDHYPYVVDDQRKVLLVSTNHNKPENREGIVCIDADDGVQHIVNGVTGKPLWQYDTNTLTVIRW